MKTCPKCGFKNNHEKPECPRCGLIFDKYKPPEVDPEPEEPEENEEMPEENEGNFYLPTANTDLHPAVKWITGIVFVFFALFFLSSFWEGFWTGGKVNIPSNNDHQAEKRNQPTKTEAATMAEKFVKQSLKAPSTADFPWYSSDRVKNKGNNKYVVHSYVDAQNAYGAKLRNWYICELRYVGDGKWICENLVFDE